MKNNLKTFLLLILVSTFISSCISNKKYVYLQNPKTHKVDSTSDFIKITIPSYRLQSGDILQINIATEDPKLNAVFSPNPSGTGFSMSSQAQGGSSMMYYQGYSIDPEGNINLPIMGKVNLNGKTIEEAKYAVGKKLDIYFKQYHLFMQLAEIRFSLIGEISHPGKYIILQNRINLLEALAFGNDLTQLGNRRSINIIRQYPEGVKIHKIDLTDVNLISSPYYYLQSNDIVYVEPMKIRTVGNFSNLQASFQTVGPLLTVLFTVLNTYILVKNLK